MTITFRGYQVAPADLEGCLFDHPDVADACVVGIPDDYSGEVPLAFIVLNAIAIKRVEKDPKELDKTKASIVKVSELTTLKIQCIDLFIFTVCCG